MSYYSTIVDVKNYTGIRKEDLGFSTEKALEDFIEARLLEVKDLINNDRNRNYDTEVLAGERLEVPPGIHQIALRMMANLIGYAVVRRDTPIVRISDFNVQQIDDKIFTPDLKRDLSIYPAKAKFRFLRVGTGSSDDGSCEL